MSVWHADQIACLDQRNSTAVHCPQTAPEMLCVYYTCVSTATGWRRRNTTGVKCLTFDGDGGVKGWGVVMATPNAHKQTFCSRISTEIRRLGKRWSWYNVCRGRKDTEHANMHSSCGCLDRQPILHRLDSERSLSRSTQTSHLDLSLDLSWPYANQGIESLTCCISSMVKCHYYNYYYYYTTINSV